MMEVAAQPVRIGRPNPFNVFPALVWKKIIDSLETPTELWNLLAVFPQLHEVTKPQEILFDKVLPMLFRDLDKKDVLTCREVCKWWEKSVDHFLENHPSQKPYHPSSYSKITDYRYCTLESKGMASVGIKNSDGLQRTRRDAESLIERHFKAPSFLGRSVRLGGDDGNDDENDDENDDRNDDADDGHLEWSEMENLLKENDMGTGVWYADFVLRRADTENLAFCNHDYYEGFRKCLEKLPNLRSLTVGEHSSSRESRGGFGFGEYGEDIGNLSLPDLPQLETLCLAHFKIIHRTGVSTRGQSMVLRYLFQEWIPREDFFHLLLNKYAPQLRKLSMSPVFWKNEYGSRLEGLTELTLDLEDQTWYRLENKEDQGILLRSILENLNSPNLEKLCIKKASGGLSLKPVFQSIQNRQFKVLNIQADIIDDYFSHGETQETLPSVLAFTLVEYDSITDQDMPLSFFKCFPNLEYLEIKIQKTPTKRELAKLAISVAPDYDEEMTIWKLFPNLKVFILNEETYAREVYE